MTTLNRVVAEGRDNLLDAKDQTMPQLEFSR